MLILASELATQNIYQFEGRKREEEDGTVFLSLILLQNTNIGGRETLVHTENCAAGRSACFLSNRMENPCETTSHDN